METKEEYLTLKEAERFFTDSYKFKKYDYLERDCCAARLSQREPNPVATPRGRFRVRNLAPGIFNQIIIITNPPLGTTPFLVVTPDYRHQKGRRSIEHETNFYFTTLEDYFIF